ncbi:peptidoglycan-binding protein [Evansella sp. AB-rgal1]|uniref:C40 family peptidase n=1 Tax=Evansella sp. AB-rgal1 TaxID=3242696 RepID=UPI00359D51B9
MSKNNMKSHKGTALFTSVVAGAALAPILSGQMEQEDKLKSIVNYQPPLFTDTAEQLTLKQSLVVVPSLSYLDTNVSLEIKEDKYVSSSLSKRNTNDLQKQTNPPLRLVTKERIETDEKIASHSISIWPVDTELALGDTGPKVKTIQEYLSENGYYVFTIDGIFGDKTKEALKLYQKENGLPINGIAAFETLVHLLGTKQTVTEERNKDIPNQPSDIYRPYNEHDNYLYISPTNYEVEDTFKVANRPSYFQYGDVHDEIIRLQELLQKSGYYKGELDGVYDSHTQQAVRTLQREHNLIVDGLAGNQVFSFLQENDLKKIADNRNHQDQSQNSSQSVEATKQTEKEKTTTTTLPNTNTPSMNSIIERAHELIGTPYVWGGTSPAGFDCSGFLVYLFNQIDENLPRTVDGIWNVTTSVSNPKIGDIVFFETYKKGPSHAGIYLGDGAFIHTDATAGVKVSYLSETYWGNRYLGAKRY